MTHRTTGRARRTEIALIAAAHAVEAIKSVRSNIGIKSWTKEEYRELVTSCDIAAHEAIMASISSHFPAETILSEEGETVAYEGHETAWVVDPLDGTVNFERGLAYWSVSVAWVQGGETQVAVVSLPDVGGVVWATLGGGLQCRGLNQIRKGTGTLVALGFNETIAGDVHAKVSARLKSVGCEYRRPGSGAAALALTARGGFDAYYEPCMRIWDRAAGLLLVTEAGGRVISSRPTAHPLGADVLAFSPSVKGKAIERIGAIFSSVNGD